MFKLSPEAEDAHLFMRVLRNRMCGWGNPVSLLGASEFRSEEWNRKKGARIIKGLLASGALLAWIDKALFRYDEGPGVKGHLRCRTIAGVLSRFVKGVPLACDEYFLIADASIDWNRWCCAYPDLLLPPREIMRHFSMKKYQSKAHQNRCHRFTGEKP